MFAKENLNNNQDAMKPTKAPATFARSHPVQPLTKSVGTIKRKNVSQLTGGPISQSHPIRESEGKSVRTKSKWLTSNDLSTESGEILDEDLDLIFHIASKEAEEKSVKKSQKKKKDDVFSNTDCKHLETINENGVEVCIECSTVLYDKITHKAEWRYYGDNDNQHSYDPSRCQYVKRPDKGIKSDLIKLGFTNQIIELADGLYSRVTDGEIKRSDLRKGIMFACVFQAYKNIGTPKTPEELQTIFKISRRKLSKGLTYFKTRIPKDDDIVTQYITAEHFIPTLSQVFDLKDEHIKNILMLYKTLEQKSSSICTSTPQSVAAGIIYYYLYKKINFPITASKFGKEVKLSEITISKISNDIDDILSS